MTRPLVALLTDFGTNDPFVGVMKGVILGRCPDAAIVDLSHALPPQAVTEGAFWLEKSARWFPEGTVFVAVVDPGVGTVRRGVVGRAHGRIFVGPDNGLLSPVLSSDPNGEAFGIEIARLGLPEPSRTFHGRDIFAPVAADLAALALAPHDVGAPLDALVPGGLSAPVRIPDGAEGFVVTIDRFGNLITNIDVPSLPRAEAPVVEVGERRLPLSQSYSDVPQDELVALVNAWDVIEVAVRDGSAKERLGLERGARVSVRHGAGEAPGGGAPRPRPST